MLLIWSSGVGFTLLFCKNLAMASEELVVMIWVALRGLVGFHIVVALYLLAVCILKISVVHATMWVSPPNNSSHTLTDFNSRDMLIVLMSRDLNQHPPAVLLLVPGCHK